MKMKLTKHQQEMLDGKHGDPNGASKLDWSVFTQAVPERQGEK